MLPALSLAESWDQYIIDEMNVIRSITNTTTALDTTAPLSCINRYSKIFSDEALDITIGIGYYDDSEVDYVWDPELGISLVKAITAPCTSKISACGFVRSKKNAALFTKTIINPFGKSHRVNLKLVRGSLSYSHSYNLANKNLQDERCKQAANIYYSAIEQGEEVVIYTGHSRDGGGPDFCPSVRTKNDHIDYNWYRKNRPGTKKLLESVATSVNNKKSPELMVFNSCYSVNHFYSKINKINPEIGFIGSTNLVYGDEDFKSMYGTLDSILALRCSSGLKAAINSKLIVTKNVFRE